MKKKEIERLTKLVYFLSLGFEDNIEFDVNDFEVYNFSELNTSPIFYIDNVKKTLQ